MPSSALDALPAVAPRAAPSPDRALGRAAAAWCAVAVAGQMIFAAYVALAYGRAALSGRPELWNKLMPHGWVAGETAQNLAGAGHVLFAVVVMVAGALQLVPAIRREAPTFHRWSGRVFVVLAMAAAASGVEILVVRNPVGDLAQHVPIVLDAVLILAFGAMAWREALARRFDAHRRWALRLYLVVSGVWFFRIGLMAWIVANRGPAGFDPKTFTGPAIVALTYAQTLVPLALLQLTLHARERGGPRLKLAATGVLGAATLLTAFGIGCATLLMWLPRL